MAFVASLNKQTQASMMKQQNRIVPISDRVLWSNTLDPG